jgi:AraC-like DNA-binding protein/mannose-6-phosphate isomerase-like protein (cupin superfamily)
LPEIDLKKYVHRNDSEERSHYVPSKRLSVLLHPRLVYSGELRPAPLWHEVPHKHDVLEFVFITKGKGHVIIEQREYNVQKGDLLIYNQNTLHSEESTKDEPIESFFLGVDNVHIEGLPENSLLRAGEKEVVSVKSEYESLYHYFYMIVTEAETQAPFSKEMTESVVRVILILILRLLSKESGEFAQYQKTNEAFERAKSYIDKNFSMIEGIDDVCKNAFLSKYYLSHVFKIYGGVSPVRYITQKKIGLAKELLANPEILLAGIASRCGYDETAYFSKVFKRSEGCSPGEYRSKVTE